MSSTQTGAVSGIDIADAAVPRKSNFSQVAQLVVADVGDALVQVHCHRSVRIVGILVVAVFYTIHEDVLTVDASEHDMIDACPALHSSDSRHIGINNSRSHVITDTYIHLLKAESKTCPRDSLFVNVFKIQL